MKEKKLSDSSRKPHPTPIELVVETERGLFQDRKYIYLVTLTSTELRWVKRERHEDRLSQHRNGEEVEQDLPLVGSRKRDSKVLPLLLPLEVFFPPEVFPPPAIDR